MIAQARPYMYSRAVHNIVDLTVAAAGDADQSGYQDRMRIAFFSTKAAVHVSWRIMAIEDQQARRLEMLHWEHLLDAYEGSKDTSAYPDLRKEVRDTGFEIPYTKEIYYPFEAALDEPHRELMRKVSNNIFGEEEGIQAFVELNRKVTRAEMVESTGAQYFANLEASEESILEDIEADIEAKKKDELQIPLPWEGDLGMRGPITGREREL